MNLSIRTGFIPALFITAAVVCAIYWYNQTQVESTTYSYVNGRIIEIAPEVDGKIAQVYVQDHQSVKRGDLLFELDQAPFKIALEKATAQFNESKRNNQEQQAGVLAAEALVKQRYAEFENAKAVYKRTLALTDKGHRSGQEQDEAQANAKKAEASLDAAKAKLQMARLAAGDSNAISEKVAKSVAALNLAQLNANRSKVYAPSDGVVSHFSLDPGEIVRANKPVLNLITTSNLWIDAQYKESQLPRLRPGQVADIHLTSYPDHTFHGVVESIAASATNLDPKISNDPRYVTVKIRMNDDPKYPLRIGTSGKVDIDVNSNAKIPVAQME